MSECGKCKKEKPRSEFYTRIRGSGPRSSYCKRCFNKYCMERWIEKKERAIELKGGKCLDCNGVFPCPVYDFHHLDADSKLYTWTKLRLRSWETIEEELSKCVMLCANCHRIRHYVDGGSDGT